ncbi:3-hydroxyacyl-CoA dehydrogenase family protein [Shewanella sp. SR43-8]|uniref:3-hydroxyacyl-CoA dehydrogenase family protein n=1 Tax=Shewanella sp. SR43-8 TaxID=2760938 RepID=UPI001601964A|nr:3-hydroxyacyl-CoA dehydrogenase NAD-binding domain-containing protein [Shewanella sp. SR43-8]MBB1322656.1 3-hydroxybutyryl-CoA dehydrogenase [Shewanella sp. SR43-8]
MKVMVIGSGTMGTGIAQLMMANNSVSELIIYSRDALKLEILNDKCISSLNRLAAKGKIDLKIVKNACNKTILSTDISNAACVDLVIEAVSESYEVKYSLIDVISEYLSSDTLFATNTSSLSVTALASRLPYPERVIGLHFFNPAPIMELVEVVKGLATSSGTINEAVKFASVLGKKAIVVNECPGFVVNRMLIPMINEAIFILADGVATKEDIDKSMILGAHHPMGPLKLADLIGNDVILSIMDTLYHETGDSKFRASPLLRKMVRANHLGKKSKLGFYSY